MNYVDVFFSQEPRPAPDPVFGNAFEAEGELLATLAHEAGHAVAGYVCGLGLRRVEIQIVASGEGVGFVGMVYVLACG